MKSMLMNILYKAYRFYSWKIVSPWNDFKMNSKQLGYRAPNTMFWGPSVIVGGQNVFLYDYTRLQGGHTIISYTAKFIMKKYSAAGLGLTVVTGNHTPTVGIPQFLLGSGHVNDNEQDVIVEEDVWIGTGVTLLAGAHLGRGSVIGAKSLITAKSIVPPYAVVVGCPSRIVAAKFTIDQIVKHEEKLYAPEERYTREELDEIFKRYFEGKKTMGVDYNLSEAEEAKYHKWMEKTGLWI
ncbi:acyltransferase [Bacteroides fluxus]|uniref:acyltransferase n=1 Tax=Bacteroides fluxus TaxID=626930 RepID=UPI0023A7B506|nr:hypothetical protein [Bacteroides fluxus]